MHTVVVKGVGVLVAVLVLVEVDVTVLVGVVVVTCQYIRYGSRQYDWRLTTTVVPVV